MYSSNKTTKTHQTKAECCTDLKCQSGLRNKYFEGKLLTADSFRVEQEYSIQRRQLLNRAIHGWGVIYGYGIGLDAKLKYAGSPPGSVEIKAGLALDKCGRELLETGRAIGIDDVIVFDKKGDRVKPDDVSAFFASQIPPNQNPHEPAKCWLLSVHYAEQDTGSITVEDSCRCKYREWDHTCETVRYSLKLVDCNECCRAWDCELNCGCGTGRCCGHPDKTSYPSGNQEEDKRQQRGGCRCICDHLIELNPGGECEHLCEIEEPCGKVRVDIHNGVPLACIDVIRDSDCFNLGTNLEVCGPRRLVKRNDLLFDLIRGCDLTTIIDFGWKDWHRRELPIPFTDFSDAFGSKVGQDYVSTKFRVRFSRPVRANTLRADCFAMTVLSSEREGGWWNTSRVPIVDVNTSDFGPEAGDPPGHVRGAAIVVDGRWVEDAVRGRVTIFYGGQTRVEFEVRGDLIVDCNGQTVDANSFGLFRAPTGNATAGGTLLSTFRVESERDAVTPPNYGSDPIKGV
jgi:hypothetical protein